MCLRSLDGMINISMRTALKSDLPAIIAMLADDKLGRLREGSSSPPDQQYIDAFDAIEQDANQMLVVADEQETVVGCLQLSLIPGLSRLGMWRGQIESVRIATTHRGEGIGRQMIEWAVEQSRQRGCGLVQLTTDKSRTRAVSFYHALGFEPSHEGLKRALSVSVH